MNANDYEPKRVDANFLIFTIQNRNPFASIREIRVKSFSLYLRPSVTTVVKQMKSQQTIQLCATIESRNVLFLEPDGSWPIVWERAQGVHVWDAEGKKYLDLTAAFGVAAAGHANPNVVNAGQKQMAKLLHAMGDVHPHALKAELARELSRLTFERWAKPNRPIGNRQSAIPGR